MRRLLTIGIMSLGLLAYAKTLSPEEALQRVYSDHEGPAKAPSEVQMNLVRTFTHSSGEAMVYLFESVADTWMAISANDIATPLLGYGDDASTAAQLPPQMEWWLSQYAAQIAYADSVSQIPSVGTNLTGGATDNPMLKALTRSDRAPIAAILKTKWNQDSPYNKLCPRVGIQRAPTGCVATALSQIMKVHEYPAQGYGTGHATVGSSTDQLDMDLEIPLRWDAMKNTYTGSYTSDQANAVAELMVAVGYGCDMNYNLDGSGAYDKNACQALISHFGYAPTTWLYMRDYYELEEWEDLIYTELENGRPIYYSGRAKDGGHAFVCDGYDKNGYFHFNWGWGGMYNGNFKIDALNPEGQGIGGFEGGYNTEQMAIMGIQPDFEGAMQPQPKLSCYSQPKASFYDNVLTLTGGWWNYCYKTEKFTVGVEAVNLDDGITYYQELSTHELKPYTGITNFKIDLRSPSYADGSYIIQLVTKTEDYPDWTPCNGPIGVIKTVDCIRHDGQWIASDVIPLVITDATYPKTIEVDEPATYTITLENLNNETLYGSYEVFICKYEGNMLTIIGDTDGEDIAEVTVPANSIVTHSQEFTIRYFEEGYESDNDLILVLADHETMDVVYTFGKIMTKSGVKVMTLDTDNDSVYSIDGVKLSGDTDNLSPGIYIIRGKKIVVR